jgi:histidine ammonia-lyase
MALDLLGQTVAAELTGAADNPLVLADDREILSTGNFHVPALTLALDAVAIAVAQVAAPMAERQARLMTARLSGLPANLTPEEAGAPSGMGPLGKTAYALVTEIRHAAAPFAIHPAVNADGVEDDSTAAVPAALRLHDQLGRLWRLVALELTVAAQAVTLAAPARLGTGTAAAYAVVREHVDELHQDRPLGPEVERFSREVLASGRLLEQVRETVPA